MSMTRRRRAKKRRARSLAVALAALCGAGVVLGITLSIDAPSAKPTHSAGPGTSSAPTSTSTAPSSGESPTAIGRYQVASTSLEITEPGTTSASAGRMLPTNIWYPMGQEGGAPSGLKARGPFPLLVFSQGYDLSVSAYESLLEDWASAGFVVAAPTYPHTDPSEPSALDENDIVNHPADLRYVIASVLDTAGGSGSVLSGLVDAKEIGVVGHSDGGDVSLAVAADSCCQDPRVKAAAILSGAEFAGFGGSYFSGNSVPLLVVQGSADTINPPACSTQIYDEAGSPKYYLDLLGAEHEPPYTEQATADQSVVAKVTTDFFDAELHGQSAGATGMIADGNVAGTTQITEGGTAPATSGGCPGAPG